MAETERACPRLEEMTELVDRGWPRIALISHPRHLADLRKSDDGLLIVSTDWLTWQNCLTAGFYAVHFETGLLDWDCRSLDTDLLIRANDWMFDGDEDATLFRGASLGRAFTRDFNLFLLYRTRLGAALDDILRRSGAKEVVLYDYQVDFFTLDPDEVADLVREVTDKFGATLTDRSDPVPASDPAAPIQADRLKRWPGLISTSDSGTWSSFRSWVESAASIVSRLLNFRRVKRRRVLCCVTHLNSIHLLESLMPSDAAPAFIARHFPDKRNLGFVARSIARGTTLIPLPAGKLSADDRRSVEDMIERLKTSWGKAEGDMHRALCRHAERHVVGSGFLFDVAREAVSCQDLLDNAEPAAFFTDSLDSPAYGMLGQMAASRGLHVFFTWHGQYIQPLRIFILGGDARVPDIVSCCLSWGKVQELWLASIGYKGAIRRTGNMVLHYREAALDDPYGRKRLADVDPATARVLLLQYTPGRNDIRGLDERQYASFVEIVRMLRRNGFRHIRMRLHPGVWKIQYFERIAQEFGLDCSIEDGGRYVDSLRNADLVIGPAQSGAMVETIGFGKPYFPIALPPHSFDPEILALIQPYDSVAALETAIVERRVVDQRRILEAFSSRHEIADPARRAWDSINDVTEHRRQACAH